MTIDELQSQAMQLSAPERELLAINLLSSLTPDDQRDIEEAWNREILARSDALHAGTASTIDAWESLENVRESLRLRNPP
jgi:putative addiction module component (TIGR02574 family)